VADDQKTVEHNVPRQTTGAAIPWHLFEPLQGKSMATLVWGRQFQVTRVTVTSIQVSLRETKGTRYVARVEMEKTLAALNEKGALTIEEVRYFAPKTASYVAALMVGLPGVTWDGASRKLVTRAGAGAPQGVGSSTSGTSAAGPAVSATQTRAVTTASPISFDALWTEQAGEALSIWQKLNPMVQRELAAMALADISQSLRILGTCESPPEQLLAARCYRWRGRCRWLRTSSWTRADQDGPGAG